MREPKTIQDVRRRLLRSGFSRSHANRTAVELHEHWQDLVEEGIRQGQTSVEAQAHADAAIGEAAKVAEDMAARLQKTSWLGRHPALGFPLLAIFGTILWWGVLLFAVASWAGMLAGDPGVVVPLKLEFAERCVDWISGLSYLALPAIICRIAQSYHCGWKPALWGCLMLSIHNSLHVFHMSATARNATVSWGYRTLPAFSDAVPVLLPLCVFALWRLWNFRPISNDHSLQLSGQ